MGIYFIARGIWMASQTDPAMQSRDHLKRLVELREWELENTYEEEREAAPQAAAE